jgi:ribosome modulation factor
MIADDRKRYERAREDGRSARRNGKRVGDCPYRGDTSLVRDLADEWAGGWREADMAIKAGR